MLDSQTGPVVAWEKGPVARRDLAACQIQRRVDGTGGRGARERALLSNRLAAAASRARYPEAVGQNWHYDEDDNIVLDASGDTVPGNAMTLGDGVTHLVRYEATLCGIALKSGDFPEPENALTPGAPLCQTCIGVANELAGR